MRHVYIFIGMLPTKSRLPSEIYKLCKNLSLINKDVKVNVHVNTDNKKHILITRELKSFLGLNVKTNICFVLINDK